MRMGVGKKMSSARGPGHAGSSTPASVDSADGPTRRAGGASLVHEVPASVALGPAHLQSAALRAPASRLLASPDPADPTPTMPQEPALVCTPPGVGVEVRHSTIHGWGAFATRDLARGESIGVYEGRRYTATEAADKDWDQQLTFVFGLADGSLIDGSVDGNFTRHINHSCKPNCVAYEVDDGHGQPSIVIEARRRIRAGEELFIDYALDVGGMAPSHYACRCGAARCRGTMVARAGA